MQRISRLFYETIVRRDGLKKYDLVVVGNYNAAKFARNFFKSTHELYDILLVNNQANNQIRDGIHSRFVNPSNIIDGTPISSTDGIGISQIYPEQNKLILYNGREISYDQLVIAEDLQNNLTSIEGLNEALNDKDHPVFTSTHDYSLKVNKDPSQFLKFSTGNIVYYIPKTPFNGASDFTSPLSNFETISRNEKQKSKISQSLIKSEYLELKYQIITANTSLIPQYQDKVVQEYIQKLKDFKIDITMNAQLVKINKEQKEIELLINDKIQKQNYDALYLQGVDSLLPSWLDGNFIYENLKLVFCQNNKVFADENTLNHKQYRNVFFFGNTIFSNYLTNKSIQKQMNLAAENVHRNFQGQKLMSQVQNNQTIFFYEGQYQMNRLDQQPNKYLNPILNNKASKVGRYFWQTKLQDKFQFLDDLQQQYITNRFYGKDRTEQQKIEVKGIVEQQEVPLKYKLQKKTIKNHEILDILSEVNKDNDKRKQINLEKSEEQNEPEKSHIRKENTLKSSKPESTDQINSSESEKKEKQFEPEIPKKRRTRSKKSE